MATIRTAEELRAWNFEDWTYLFADWDCLVDEGFINYLGVVTDDCDFEDLAELLTEQGYETQEDVDQMWLDIHDAQNRLGIITDGFAKVAPVVFGLRVLLDEIASLGGSEEGTEDGSDFW